MHVHACALAYRCSAARECMHCEVYTRVHVMYVHAGKSDSLLHACRACARNACNAFACLYILHVRVCDEYACNGFDARACMHVMSTMDIECALMHVHPQM